MVSPRPPLPPDASLAERFARFADEVVLGLGARWHADRMSGVAFISVQLLELVGIRLQKLRKRFLALIARAQAALLPLPRPPRDRKRTSPKATTPVSRAVRLAAETGDVAGGALPAGFAAAAGPSRDAGVAPQGAAGGATAPAAVLDAGAKARPGAPAASAEAGSPSRTTPAAPEPDPAALVAEKPMRKRPVRMEPYKRKPKWTEPGTEWRKWRGIWMLEPIRKPA